jgi:hypothetical protein
MLETLLQKPTELFRTNLSFFWRRLFVSWNLELGINDFVQKSRCTYPDRNIKQLLIYTSYLFTSKESFVYNFSYVIAWPFFEPKYFEALHRDVNLEWAGHSEHGSCLSQRVLVDGGHFGTPFMGLQAFATRVVVCMQPTAFSIGCHLRAGDKIERRAQQQAVITSVCLTGCDKNSNLVPQNPTWPLERHVLPLLWPPSPRPRPPRQYPLLLPPLPLLTRGPSARQRPWTRRKRRSPPLLPPQVCLCVRECGRLRERVSSSCRRRRTRAPRTLAMCRLQPFHPHSLMSLVHGSKHLQWIGAFPSFVSSIITRTPALSI